MDGFYGISIAILAVTLVNFFLVSRMKNSWYRKIAVGLNFIALIVLVAAIVFKAFNH